mgnify:CR=1 FL=1
MAKKSRIACIPITLGRRLPGVGAPATYKDGPWGGPAKAYRAGRGGSGVIGPLSNRFNILWANTETLKGTLFARMAQPDVRRRFADPNPAGRQVAIVLERALSYGLDVYDSARPLAAALGVDGDALEQAAESDEVRQMLIDSTNGALARGVFGVPGFIVGGELYWGKDRMEFIEDALSKLEA